MKYSSQNQLTDFRFHDAFLTYQSWEDDVLMVTAERLNIYATAADSQTDMELDTARITLEDVRCESISYSPVQSFDEHGNPTDYQPERTVIGPKATEILLQTLIEGCALNGLTPTDDGAEIEFNGYDVFTARLSFSSVLVEWDSFHQNA